VIIRENISQNRVITTVNEEIISDQPIITRFLWKLGLNSRSLQLLVDDGNGKCFAIELDGEIYLEFGSKHCTQCGQIIPYTSRQAVCDLCKENHSYMYRRCIFEGPGVPFGIHCTKENPPCKTDWMIAKCWSKHYLYLGKFGNGIKVGISNCRRREGKYYRLIEQGLDEALALTNFSSLQEVLEAENFIAEKLRLTTFFTFNDKIDLVTTNDNNCLTVDFHYYIDLLKEYYPKAKFSIIDLTDVWQGIPKDTLIRRNTFPEEIKGEIIASRGNLLFVKSAIKNSSENIIDAYNLSHLIGCDIISLSD